MIQSHETTDIFVIGGGVNGCGIARDAAGRGLQVRLAEQQDIGEATSSASSKLFHGGLRYLEHMEFNLVRKSLQERETLLRAMPHISFPMRFVMPHHKGLRPRWLIRLGLFIYDHLGKRQLLPGSKQIDLRQHMAGALLQDKFSHAFEYSDCWVHDSRLVSLNARAAAQNGADILTHTKVINAQVKAGLWHITCLNKLTGDMHTFVAKKLVNAAGPWIAKVIADNADLPSDYNVRLVRGSHIVVHKLFDHDQPYILQGADGRIIFLLPFEHDYTLIGTTDVDHAPDLDTIECSDEEAQYLCDLTNEYIKKPIAISDIVWRFAGVRPLFDDGNKNASAATRDYVLELQGDKSAPLVNVFGGKITTYRKLAEAVMEKLYSHTKQQHWTDKVPLPGGDIDLDQPNALVDLSAKLLHQYPFLSQTWAQRLINTYGTDSFAVLGEATSLDDLGVQFGADLSAQEVQWLMQHEFAKSADDIVWRRTKLGLKLSPQQIQNLHTWMQQLVE